MNHLANMLSNIRVGYISNLKFVIVKKTALNIKVLKVIYNLGFIFGFSVLKNNIKIFLKYKNRRPVLHSLVYLKKLHNKEYIKVKNFHNSLFNQHLNYFSNYIICHSSKGVLTDFELLLYRIGGQPICIIN